MSTSQALVSTTAPEPTEESPSLPPPWEPLFRAHDRFLNHLDCIHEMFKLVSPLIERKDKERQDRIRKLGEDAERDGKPVRRITSVQEMREFLGHVRRMHEADRLFRQNTVVSIVSKFDEFLATIIRIAFEQNPNWLKSPDKTITYKELLDSESLELFKTDLLRKEVDALMRDSHNAQIEFLDSKLKLGVEEHFKAGWLRFLEITERRNLFVHNGGVVNSVYVANANKLGFKLPESAVLGKYLSASDDYVSSTIDCCYELSVRIAQAAARRLFPDCYNEADKRLNNTSVDLLNEERWALAERVFKYARGIPDKMIGDAE